MDIPLYKVKSRSLSRMCIDEIDKTSKYVFTNEIRRLSIGLLLQNTLMISNVTKISETLVHSDQYSQLLAQTSFYKASIYCGISINNNLRPTIMS